MLCALVSVFCFVGAAVSAPVTYSFTAEIVSSSTNFVGLSKPAIGDDVFGQFTYDPEEVASNDHGYYADYINPAARISASFLGISTSSRATHIQTFDDPVYWGDGMIINAHVTGANLLGVYDVFAYQVVLLSANLSLQDRISLPKSLSLSDYEKDAYFWFFGENDSGVDTFRANLKSLNLVTPVPIPAALPLLAGAIGIFGVVGWRRKRPDR